MNFLMFLGSVLVGGTCFAITSHNRSPIHKKIPNLKINRVQILPSFKIYARRRVIHLHHWIYLTLVLTVSFVTTSAFLDSFLTRGFIIGGILQGLSFRDFKKIVYKEN